ncbi:arylsulfatase [Geobacter sp. OR-1]|uniref:MBL fold metallo-hydrolase n=1 Tax=Geobacter sp. OR-1 TaxID=1266765 RepID=UPI000541F2EE|nr:MBL fold metallo-hydrolase [Geobacter sp. OR-1]GAM09273.1 arylsulfatase [Geobacter sp. OR-1]
MTLLHLLQSPSITVRIFTLLFVSILPGICCAASVSAPKTRLVLLGTGNPQPDPDRSGPASAIVVNGNAYLVDFGPGVVRRAAAARLDKGITELDPVNIRVVFSTHLHSDHTAGFPDLILTPWTMGRRHPLEVYGPKGINAMTDHILAAYSEDIAIRTKGMEQEPVEGVKVNVHEIKAGVVYKDANVTVTAFPTKHGEWIESYGYRFDTADRSIVITGDTIPTQATIDACKGCDLLVHEALTEKFLDNPMRPNAQGYDIRAYAEKYHTTTSQLVELANKARPGLLVLYHNPITLRPQRRPMASTPDDLLQEMKGYKGRLAVGRDLDVY